MKLAIATLLAGSAVAFSPSAQKASSSALKMGFESELGVVPPTGFFVSLRMFLFITSIVMSHRDLYY